MPSPRPEPSAADLARLRLALLPPTAATESGGKTEGLNYETSLLQLGYGGMGELASKYRELRSYYK